MANFDSVLTGNDGCEVEYAIDIGHRFACVTSTGWLKFNVNILDIAADTDNFTGDAETFEYKINVFSLAANVRFSVKVYFKLLWLKTPTGWRWDFQYIFTLVVDRQKIISIRWWTIGFILQTALFGQSEIKTQKNWK